MIQTFLSGGVIMWPLLALALGILWIAIRTAGRLRNAPAADDVRWRLHTLLFWGGMSLLLGLLGTVVGLVIMAENIQRAGGVAPQLAWSGVGVSLVSFLFGILIFLFAGAAWLILSYWNNRAEEGAGRRVA